MKRSKLNYWVDMFIGASLVASAVSGLVFLPNTVGSSVLGISYRVWDVVHTWSSLAMIAGAGLHLLLHWKWLVTMTKRMLVPQQTRVEGRHAGGALLTRRRFLCLGLGAAALATVAAAFAGTGERGSDDSELAEQAPSAGEPASETPPADANLGDGTQASESATPSEVAEPTPVPDKPELEDAEADQDKAPLADEPPAVETGTVEPEEVEDDGSAAETGVPEQELGVACPFGLVNDPYPGRCRRYIDLNEDGICDYSVLGSGSNRPRL